MSSHTLEVESLEKFYREWKEKIFFSGYTEKKISKDFQDDLNMIEKLESVLQERK